MNIPSIEKKVGLAHIIERLRIIYIEASDETMRRYNIYNMGTVTESTWMYRPCYKLSVDSRLDFDKVVEYLEKL